MHSCLCITAGLQAVAAGPAHIDPSAPSCSHNGRAPDGKDPRAHRTGGLLGPASCQGPSRLLWFSAFGALSRAGRWTWMALRLSGCQFSSAPPHRHDAICSLCVTASDSDKLKAPRRARECARLAATAADEPAGLSRALRPA